MNKEINEQEKKNFIAVWKSYFHKGEAFLLPNILCYFRILLVFVFFALYLVDFELAGNPNANVYFATAVMIIASYTDFIDGYIARTFHMQSNLGKVVDPVADKMLQVAIVLALCIKMRSYPAVYSMLILLVVKESTLIIQNIMLARQKKSFGGAKWYGKVSSFIFYLVLGSLLFFGPTIMRTYPLDTAEGFRSSHMIIDSLCTVAIFFLLFSWISYTITTHKLVRQGREEMKKEMLAEKKDTAEEKTE